MLGLEDGRKSTEADPQDGLPFYTVTKCLPRFRTPLASALSSSGNCSSSIRNSNSATLPRCSATLASDEAHLKLAATLLSPAHNPFLRQSEIISTFVTFFSADKRSSRRRWAARAKDFPAPLKRGSFKLRCSQDRQIRFTRNSANEPSLPLPPSKLPKLAPLVQLLLRRSTFTPFSSTRFGKMRSTRVGSHQSLRF